MSTVVGNLIRELRRDRLVLHHVDLIEEDGESEWFEGVNISGPEGCDCCGDEFSHDQFHVGDDDTRVMAVWHNLVLDLRDPDDPTDAHPETRALCTYCKNEWDKELTALGLLNPLRLRLEIARELVKAIPVTNATVSERAAKLRAIDDQIDDLATGVAS